jgi:hypothetical protein
MAKTLLEPIEKTKHRACRIVKGQADYYCVRCNWRGDEPESPREGESWYCCPVCRGHALPWERRHRGIAARR